MIYVCIGNTGIPNVGFTLGITGIGIGSGGRGIVWKNQPIQPGHECVDTYFQ
jgi:hypothetical protein